MPQMSIFNRQGYQCARCTATLKDPKDTYCKGCTQELQND